MSDAVKLGSAWETFKLGSLWQMYAKANIGESRAVDDYVAAVVNGGTTTVPPTPATATGKGLVGLVAAGFFQVVPPASKYTVKNATAVRSFDAKKTTVDELAAVVATVIGDAGL